MIFLFSGAFHILGVGGFEWQGFCLLLGIEHVRRRVLVNFHTEIKLNVIISLSADDEWARQRLIVETCAWLSERELLSGAATMTSTGQVLERISHFQLHCSALVS